LGKSSADDDEDDIEMEIQNEINKRLKAEIMKVVNK